MDLADEIIRRHLEEANLPLGPEAADAEAERIEKINALPLDAFLHLPPEEQVLAEEVWAARVLEANVRRQEERRVRIEQARSACPGPFPQRR